MRYIQMLERGAIPWAAALCAALAWTAPNPARASEIEEFTQLALHPSDPDRMLLHFAQAAGGAGGLFYTEDGGRNWRMLCGAMLAPGEDFAGAIALSNDGLMFHTSFDGLWQGDNGCNWSIAPELAVPIQDVSGHPDDPNVTFAVTADGTGNNAAWRREASGTWTMLGTEDPSRLSRIRVVPLDGGGLRIYESGQRALQMIADDVEPPKTIYMIRVSDDMGMTWAEFSFEMSEGVERFRLEAVDPTRPDRIVASVRFANMPDRVVVSDDKGETFRDYLSVTDFGGLNLAPDGRIWIGDRGDPFNLDQPKGLWFAANLDTTAAPVSSDYGVQCVTYQPKTDTLYICQRWQFGAADTQTALFTKRFDFSQAREFVSCPGVDAAQVCKPQLCAAYCGPNYHFSAAPLCSVYTDPDCGPAAAELDRSLKQGNGTGPLGGRADDSADPMTPMPSEAAPKHAGGGCTLQPGRAQATGPLLLATLLAVFLVARRGRRAVR